MYQTRLSRSLPEADRQAKASQDCGLGISQFHTHTGFPRLLYLPTLPWCTHLGAVLVGWGRDILRGHHCQSWGWGGMLHHGIDSHGGSVVRRKGATQLVESRQPRGLISSTFFSPNLEYLELLEMQRLDAGSSGEQVRGMGRGQVERSLLCYFDSKEITFKLYVKQSVPQR